MSTTHSKFTQVYLHCVQSGALSKRDMLKLFTVSDYVSGAWRKQACRRPETQISQGIFYLDIIFILLTKLMH